MSASVTNSTCRDVPVLANTRPSKVRAVLMLTPASFAYCRIVSPRTKAAVSRASAGLRSRMAPSSFASGCTAFVSSAIKMATAGRRRLPSDDEVASGVTCNFSGSAPEREISITPPACRPFARIVAAARAMNCRNKAVCFESRHASHPAPQRAQSSISRMPRHGGSCEQCVRWNR